MAKICLSGLVLALTAGTATAAPLTIDFEGVAPPGGVVIAGPDDPYTELGFTFTPFFDLAGVVSASSGLDMIGNDTDWFFINGGNTDVTIDRGGEPFFFGSLLAGPTTNSAINPGNFFRIRAEFSDGSGAFSQFPGLSTAERLHLGWRDVVSVNVFSISRLGIDDIVVTPLPGTLPMALAGLGVLALMRRRAAQAI